MKSTFSGYYQPSKEEFSELWKSCIFAFDASVLLDLYRSTAKTRDVLLDILKRIHDRIWLPYQAAFEYQENRLEVISRERTVYVELQDSLNNLASSFKQKMQNHAIENADQIAQRLESATRAIEEIIKQGAKDHPDLKKSDHIRDQITNLFEGRVGKQFQEKKLQEIYQEGTKRFELKIPPGYEDAKKGGTRQFGDLVVWKELIDRAGVSKVAIVFVTSDSKSDWWWKHAQVTIGPRPELVQEMMNVSGQRFYMYNVERFLEQAQQYLDTKVESGAVKKAATEFKDIQNKKQNESDLALSEADLGVADQPAESLKRHFRKLPFDELSTEGLVGLSPGDWAELIESVHGKQLSPSEVTNLESAIKTGQISRIVQVSKTMGEAVRAASIFLYLSSKLLPTSRSH
jgi:hypothetical protein